MDKFKQAERLLDHYRQMTGLMLQQKTALQANEGEVELEHFSSLADRWQEHADTIDQLLQSGVPIPEAAIPFLNEMNECQAEMDRLLREIQARDFRTMDAVKKQQTVVRHYGGVGNQENIALYFDEKQ